MSTVRMAKTGYINTRVEPKLKEDAEGVFRQLGVSTSEAISIFLTQVVAHRGLPFPVRLPNEETIEAFNEPRDNLPRYHSVEELMSSLLDENE